MPSDINLVMYISHDEKYDQNGVLLEPATWRTGSDIADPVTQRTEHYRRVRYDQGFAHNHMYFDPVNQGSLGGYTTTFASSEKSSPCNRHSQMGDANDGSVLGRKTLFYGGQYLIVDRRPAGWEQTDVDFTDDFTLIQWVNPVLTWIRGDLWNHNAGHKHELWSRYDLVDTVGFGVDVRGWIWTLGGPPWFFGGPSPPPLSHINPGVNGFTFLYLPEGDIWGSGSPEDMISNSAAGFWPYEYEQDLDSSDDGTGLYPVDAGKYCGWLFCALRCSAAYTDPTSPYGVDVSDFTMFVGRADRGDIAKLDTVTLPRLRSNMWTIPSEGIDAPGDIMITMNQSIGGVRSNNDLYEQIANLNHFGKFDESRIYNRALADGEIKALYSHPGGQKRTENPLEIERQV
jgi:hypothetical protein